jgi:NAD(P)H-dependent FMN reductase
MLNLHVIVASTRPGRAGSAIAEWALTEAAGHAAFRTLLVDLAKVNLPLLDEPHHPRLMRYEHQHTKDWSATIAAADAFVIVTPEYDYGMPAALLNALHYLSAEWAYKPVGFVSYGGVSAGTRSVQMAKLVITALKMMPIPEAVSIPFFSEYLKDGSFTPPPAQNATARVMLNELERWASALAPLRAKK